jgi:Cdc6-like AAA superfamily ATPase
MDPVRNPYTPGAGTRPPVLAGREGEIAQFENLIQRLLAGRPEKSLMVTGLRGVGKTVLLSTFADFMIRTYPRLLT